MNAEEYEEANQTSKISTATFNRFFPTSSYQASDWVQTVLHNTEKPKNFETTEGQSFVKLKATSNKPG